MLVKQRLLAALFILFVELTAFTGRAWAQNNCIDLQKEGKWDEHLKCLFQELKLVNEQNSTQKDSLKSVLYFNIANIFFKISDKSYFNIYADSAFYFANLSGNKLIQAKLFLIKRDLIAYRNICRELNDSSMWMAYHLKKCSFHKGNKDSTLFKNLDSAALFIQGSNSLRKFQYYVGRAESEACVGNNAYSLELLAKAQTLLKPLNDIEVEHHFALTNFKVYKLMHDTAKAYHWFLYQDSIRRIFQDKPSVLMLREIEDLRQLNSKNEEILNEKTRSLRFILISVFVFILFVLALVFGYFYRKQNLLLHKYNQNLNYLFTTISHDFRSPLVSIQYLLRENNVDTGLIKRKLRNLNYMVDDLLSWTALNLKAIHLNKVDLDVQELINQIIEQYDFEIKQKNLKVKFDDAELLLKEDISVLTVILRNTLFNAINYAALNSELKVKSVVSGNTCEIEIENITGSEDEHLIPSKGIGLFITKELANISNFKIAFLNQDNLYKVKLSIERA
jgi:signal transduction histidine kinase